jgi:uncharacterized membrane protein YfcA
MLFGPLAVISGFFGAIFIPNALRFYLPIVVALLAATLANYIYSSFKESASESGAIIIARTRRDAPTWWERNREGLAQNAIVSAVFGVIGFLVGHFVH